jgi:hypothetical protein
VHPRVLERADSRSLPDEVVVHDELPETLSQSARRSMSSYPLIDIDDDESDEFLSSIRGRRE